MKKSFLFLFLFLTFSAFAQAPNTAEYFFKSGLERGAASDFDGAITDFTRVIELDPRHARAYNGRCMARRAKQDIDNALTDCSIAISLDPAFANAYYNRGMLRIEKKAVMDAVA